MPNDDAAGSRRLRPGKRPYSCIPAYSTQRGVARLAALGASGSPERWGRQSTYTPSGCGVGMRIFSGRATRGQKRAPGMA